MIRVLVRAVEISCAACGGMETVMKKLLVVLLILSVIFSIAMGIYAMGLNSEPIQGGIQGPPGENGERGATIQKVEFDAEGRIVITLTDGTVLDPVTIPKKEEHVHSFGDLMIYGNVESVTCDMTMHYRVCNECYEVMWVSGNEGSHDFSDEYSYDANDHWIDCSKCSAVKDKSEHDINDDGACNVCKQQLTASKGVVYQLSADGTYARVVDYTASAKNVVISDTYEGVPVTEIGTRAFQWKEITSVVIPDTVTFIGQAAFAHCADLVSVEMGNGVTEICPSAFFQCSSLISVKMSDKMSYIGTEAFSDCYELEYMTLPDSVTFVGARAFYDCHSLIDEEDGISYIGDFVLSFDDSVASATVREGTRVILPQAFVNSSKLISITIPESVTIIGDEAFSNCENLGVLNIPNGVTSLGKWILNGSDNVVYNEYDNACYIGNATNPYLVLVKAKDTDITSCQINANTRYILESAFSECTCLASIVIPEGIDTIPQWAFYNNQSLKSVTIPKSVTTISNWAFYLCENLENVYIDDLTAWCNVSFGESDSSPFKYAKNLYVGEKLVTDLVIPEGVKTISYELFTGCRSIQTVNIGNEVESIELAAFYGCYELVSATIGDGVKSIGRSAFYNCYSLESVTIAASVTSIKANAFLACSEL